MLNNVIRCHDDLMKITSSFVRGSSQGSSSSGSILPGAEAAEGSIARRACQFQGPLLVLLVMSHILHSPDLLAPSIVNIKGCDSTVGHTQNADRPASTDAEVRHFPIISYF